MVAEGEGWASYSWTLVSMTWQTKREIMEVLPAPDWAWAMTPWTVMIGMTAHCWMDTPLTTAGSGGEVTAHCWMDMPSTTAGSGGEVTARAEATPVVVLVETAGRRCHRSGGAWRDAAGKGVHGVGWCYISWRRRSQGEMR